MVLPSLDYSAAAARRFVFLGCFVVGGLILVWPSTFGASWRTAAYHLFSAEVPPTITIARPCISEFWGGGARLGPRFPLYAKERASSVCGSREEMLLATHQTPPESRGSTEALLLCLCLCFVVASSGQC